MELTGRCLVAAFNGGRSPYGFPNGSQPQLSVSHSHSSQLLNPSKTRIHWFHYLKLRLIYDWQSVGQFVLVSGTHLGPASNFSLSLKFPLDSCGFIIMTTPNLQYLCTDRLENNVLILMNGVSRRHYLASTVIKLLISRSFPTNGPKNQFVHHRKQNTSSL
jgi:hypothetical protein